MSCTSPLKGFYTFKQNQLHIPKNENVPRFRSNKKIVVTSFSVNHLELVSGSLVRCYDENISPLAESVFKEYIEIPCGHCLSCRLRRSREWANRCMLELPYHKYSYFVTLTYSDEFVPFSTTVGEDGYFRNTFSLKKKDVQDFIKRLRKNYKYDNHIKYYAVGEYGDLTARPHYHLIIFGLQLDDLKFYKSSSLGFSYYNSSFLDSVWKKGHVVVTDVSWETCAYVARYILKKQLGNSSWIYDDLCIEPEFSLMSLKPAIGFEYFQEHKDEIYELDKIYITTKNGGKQFKPPKYFDSKMTYNFDDFAILDDVRTVRQAVAQNKMQLKLKQTDLNELEYLELEAGLLETKIKGLPRKEI